ncbi:MAG: diguanylate cyclase [Myxococcaceae bacterium]
MGTPNDSVLASEVGRAEAPASQPTGHMPDVCPEALEVLRQTACGAHARLEALLHGVAAGVLFVGREGRVDLVNHALCRMLGVASAGELVGQPGSAVARVLSDRFADPAAFVRQGLLQGGRRLQLADGRVLSRELLPVGEGEAHGVLVLLRDVTASPGPAAELEPLHTVSLVDELTGLPNRRGFLAQASRRLRRAAQEGRAASLFCIDVEGTRTINQRLGHTAGDKALEEVGGLLRLAFRESDVLGRLGGDEFAVLAMDVAEAQQAETLERLSRAVASLNARPARAWRLSMGVGAACFDVVHRPPVEDLLSAADARLHAWKRARQGRGGSG